MEYEVMEFLSQRAQWERPLTATQDMNGFDKDAIASFRPESIEVYHDPDNMKFFGVSSRAYHIAEGFLHGRRAFMVVCPDGDETLTGIFYI